MKSIVYAVLAGTALSASAAAMAQTVAPLTRAQVRAELVALEKVGYQPGRPNDNQYPADIQAAEARLHAASVAAPLAGTAAQQ